MEDHADQLIRSTLGRRPPPKLGPTLADDVLRRVAVPRLPAFSSGRVAARRRLAAATWLLTAVASVTVLAHLEWSSGARALAWGLALAVVPLAYSATLWPRGALSLVALCGGPLVGESRGEPGYGTNPGKPERG